MYRFRRLNSAILFSLLFPALVSGQKSSRPATVRTVVVSSESNQERRFEDIIRTSILTQLQLDGFMPGRLNFSDYIIEVSYEIIGFSLSLSFEARQIGIGGERIISEVSWEGPLSLNLDNEIQDVVHTAVTRQMRKTFQVEEAKPDNKWSLDLSFSNVVQTHESSQIAKLGIGGHVSFGYVLFLKRFSLNPGFKTGLIWIPTKAICSDDSKCPNITMVPLVAEIKFSYALNQELHPYLTGGFGGVWLFKFVPIDKEIQGGLEPYADAAFGIDIRLTDVFGIFVEAELHNAFEKIGALISDISHITGIAMNMGVGFRY